MKNLSKLIASVFVGSMILACIGCYIGPPHVTSIEIISEPTKTEYFVGDKLDITGLKVVAHLSNRGTRILFGDNYPHESYGEEIIYDFSTPNDNAEVRIIYYEMEVSFTVKVIEPTLLNIEISRPAKKTEYYVGDKLDISDLKITAFFNNGEKNYDYFSFGKKFIFEFDSSIAGDNIPVKIKFLDKELSYTVRVIPVEVEKIKITKPAKRTYYCIGQELDTTGLEISAIYNNGISKVITDYQAEFDNSQEGYNIPVTIKYNEFAINYTVKVYKSHYFDSISCAVCGHKKTEYILTEFRSILSETDVKYITADSSEVGITISEDKQTVNIYGIKFTDYADSCMNVMPKSIVTADLSGIDFTKIETSYLFNANENLTSVILPDSVSSIGVMAFNGCSSLTSINIPSSATSIGDFAFMHCSSLTSVTIPSSISSIGEDAWFGCYRLKIYITDINKWAQIDFFDNRSNPLSRAEHLYLNGSEITELEFNNNLNYISSFAFYNWKDLTSVTIPKSVTSIGNYAFASCPNLTTVNINSSIGSIRKGTFEDCKSLSHINMLYGITSIEDRAFKGCSSLSDVSTILFNVTSIGAYAFYECTSLNNIFFYNSLTSIGKYAFYKCQNLDNIEIPNSVISIGEEAFKCDYEDRYPYPSKTTIYYKGFATGAPWGAKEVIRKF